LDKSITSRDYKLFLAALIKARKARGITQVDLAKRIGETQSFVSKCERGERRLDIIEVRAFCQAMGMKLAVFAGELERVLSKS